MIEDGPNPASQRGLLDHPPLSTAHVQAHITTQHNHPPRPAYSLCMHIHSKGQGLNLEALSLFMSIALLIENQAQAVQVRIQHQRQYSFSCVDLPGAFNRPYVNTTCKWLIGQDRQHSLWHTPYLAEAQTIVWFPGRLHCRFLFVGPHTSFCSQASRCVLANAAQTKCRYIPEGDT